MATPNVDKTNKKNGMKNNNKPIIAITMGDPCGIGPEIISCLLYTSPSPRD